MKLFVFLFLITSPVFASTAKFSLNFHVINLADDSEIERFECEVRQTLTWENLSNFFNCTTSSGEKVQLMNVGVTVGYVHDANMAYSSYRQYGRQGLVSNLFQKLEIPYVITDGSELKINYKKHAPVATSDEYLIETDDGAALLMVVDGLSYL